MEDRMLSDEILMGIINSKSGGGGGGTNDYNNLSNQPQINGNTLVGNKTASDLGLADSDTVEGILDGTNIDSFADVEAALAGKQNNLTAGDYISINAGNEISVNRELTPHQTSYRIKGTGRDTMNITKYIDGVQESSTDYVYSQGTTRTIDDAFTINDTYSSAGYIWQFVWLKDSTTHDKDYVVEYRSYEGAFDFTEVFNDEDLSGYKLVIKSEMDAALADKQDATDNSLDTTDKTIVGAINEHEGDIDSLKSGLTNLDVALSVPEGTGKNVIPMTLAAIKAANTVGTWSGNVYTINDFTFTVQTDSDGNVSGISANGTVPSNLWGLPFYLPSTSVKDGKSYILTGCPNGGSSSTYTLYTTDDSDNNISDYGNGITYTANFTGNAYVRIAIYRGATVNNIVFHPMIRPATITDPTFAPYIPSVESRIEAVESDIANNEITVTIENPSDTILYQKCVRINKLVIFSVKVTVNTAISSGNYIIGGLPKVATTLGNDVSLVACATNKKDITCALANRTNDGAVFSMENIESGTNFVFSGIYVTN